MPMSHIVQCEDEGTVEGDCHVEVYLVDPTEGMHKTRDEEEPSQGDLKEMRLSRKSYD
jgi:hypothetical protein